MRRFIALLLLVFAVPSPSLAIADVIVRYKADESNVPITDIRVLINEDGSQFVNQVVPLGAPDADDVRESLVSATLKRGVAYDVTLFSRNGPAESPASNTINFTIPEIPGTPELKCVIVKAQDGSLIIEVPVNCP